MNMRKLPYLLAISLISLAMLAGCAITPENIQTYVADAKDLGEVSTRLTLAEAPDATNGLAKAVQAMEIIEKQTGPATADQLIGIVGQLPINKLQSQKAQLIILGSKILLRRILGSVELGRLVDLKPIVAGLRQGVIAGYPPPKPTP